MNKQTASLIIGIVAIAIFFGRSLMIQKLSNELISLMGKDEEKFMKKINSLAVKLSFQPFNRDFMVLNHYIMTENEEKIEDQFNYLDAHKLNKKQTLSLYQNVFMYYIKKNNAEKAKDVYGRLCQYVDEKNLDTNIKDKYRKDLAVYIDKDIQIIDELDEMIKNANDDGKALLYLEKTYVYKYNHKMDEAFKSMNKVLEYTKNPAQKKVMQDLLDNKLEAL
ncbi:MAG: hypothetical protein ACI4U3_09025 [Traorella sp.]